MSVTVSGESLAQDAPQTETAPAATEDVQENASKTSEPENTEESEQPAEGESEASEPESPTTAEEPSAAQAEDSQSIADEGSADETNASPEMVEEDAYTDDDFEEEDEGEDGDPSLLERRIVAFVATGASVVSLGVGGVFAGLAWQQNQCLQDVVECNKSLDDPIEGTEYLDEKTSLEHKAVIADMAFLFAGAAALVAVTGFVRGFILTGEEEGEESDDSLARMNSQEDRQATGKSEPVKGFNSVQTALKELN